jgi:hypothetical protein
MEYTPLLYHLVATALDAALVPTADATIDMI